MTRLWPEGEPIRVATDREGDWPVQFTWRGQTHDVDHITRQWRVHLEWWRDATWRAYYKLTTTSGLLVIIYRDLPGGDWFLQRLFD